MKQRIESWDILKGIGIFLVILGHVTQNKDLADFIYAFHMPLFFIVSGYFLHNKKNFIKSQAKTLIMPYLFFGLLSFIYWWLLELPFRDTLQGESIGHQFLNLFIPHVPQICNVVLWFLPCLFLSSLIANIINSRISSIVGKIVVTLILVVFVGKLPDNLPFLLGQVAQALPYVLFGCLLAKIPIKEMECKLIQKLGGIVLTIVGIIPIWYIGVTCNMLNCSYTPCYPVSYIVAIWTTICIFILSYFIHKNKILSWLGLNSLAIMLMHEPVKRVIIKLYSLITSIPINALRESIPQCLWITIITLLVLFPMVVFVNKYAPFLLGKYKNR